MENINSITKPHIKLKYKVHLPKNNCQNYQPISLYPEQIEHKNKLMEILKISPFAFDFSMLGTGKTYTSCKIYQELALPNIVTIIPTSVKTSSIESFTIFFRS